MGMLGSSYRRRFLKLAVMGMAAVCLPGCRDDGYPEEELRRRFLHDLSQLPDLHGNVVPFSVYSGVALVVNIWASWCPPCVVEMPSLEKMGKFFDPKDLRVIGVSVDKDLNLVREFLLRSKLTFPMLLDRGNEVLRTPIFPSTFLLRRDHTIAQVVVGERDWVGQKMIEEIEQKLAVKRLP